MKDINKGIIKKANKPQQRRTYVARGRSSGKSIRAKVMAIVDTARQKLVDDGTMQLITDEKELHRYVNTMIKNGKASIDTETTGLDPIDDDIVGISLYTPNEKPAYIPIWHTDFDMKPIEENIEHDKVKKQIQRCIDGNVGFVFHNAKFDMRVTRNQLGMTQYIRCICDTQVAGNLLNEIEPHGLKYLWNKYVNKGSENDAESFDKLFESVPFNFIPLDIAYLYAALDARITWELYEFQERFLNPENKICLERKLDEVASVLNDIELPVIPHLCDMEDTGVQIDKKVADELSTKYSEALEKAEAK